jgi:hypothetical protein
VKYVGLKQLRDDNSRAFCRVCNNLVAMSHGGENDIKKHISAKQGQQLHNQVTQNPLLCTFMTTSQDRNAIKVIAAELTHIYHAVQHEHSSRSLDYQMKLNAFIFNKKIE